MSESNETEVIIIDGIPMPIDYVNHIIDKHLVTRQHQPIPHSVVQGTRSPEERRSTGNMLDQAEEIGPLPKTWDGLTSKGLIEEVTDKLPLKGSNRTLESTALKELPMSIEDKTVLKLPPEELITPDTLASLTPAQMLSLADLLAQEGQEQHAELEAKLRRLAAPDYTPPAHQRDELDGIELLYLADHLKDHDGEAALEQQLTLLSERYITTGV